MTDTPTPPDRLEAPATEAGRTLLSEFNDPDGMIREEILAIEAESRRALDAEVERLRRTVERYEAGIAAMYVHEPVVIATLCDEHADRSGALLGRVRDAALSPAAPETPTSPNHEMGPPHWEPGLAHDEWANRCLADGELWPCKASRAPAAPEETP